jgi:adenine-specific DNA-methyltransferase
MAHKNKIKLHSMDIKKEKKEKLKQLFPEVFNEEKIDIDKFKISLGEYIDVGRERYGMNWPGKSQAIKVAQLPSFATLKPDENSSVDFDTTKNLFIEGDNLEVLKLLQKSYFGKIKMIYIDPPYNTGKEFIYPDKYEEGLQTYLQYTGQIDSEGKKFSTNVETDGRFHSKWMNMMWPRLFLARNLLKEDGVIFISINDHEIDNLKKICNEVFGEENFLTQLVWSNKEGGGSSDSKYFRVKHEYILCYSKKIEQTEIKGVDISNRERYTLSDEYIESRGQYYLQKLGMGSIQYSESLDYAIETPDKSLITPKENNNGKKACWRWSKNKYEWGVINGFVEIKKDNQGIWTVYTKQYLNCDNEGNIITRTQRPFGIIEKFSSTQASKLLDALGFNGYFNYSKPLELIKYLIGLVVDKEDIIFDFFAGSGTTAHAVMQLNLEDGSKRKFIMAQLPEPTIEGSEPFKAGFNTIAKIGEERIRKAGKKIIEENIDKEGFNENKFDKGFKVFKLDKSNFSVWDNTSKGDIQKKLELYIDNTDPTSKEEDILYEIILKAGFELSEKIEQIQIGDKTVYSILDGQLLICLDKQINKNFIRSLAEKKPKQFICLNSSFKEDADLTNTAKILENNQIEFRTI